MDHVLPAMSMTPGANSGRVKNLVAWAAIVLATLYAISTGWGASTSSTANANADVQKPFSALVSKPPLEQSSGAATLRSADWLGVERVISITPSVASVQSLRTLTTRGSRASRPFFGVGDPAFSSASAEIPRASTSSYGSGAGDVNALRKLPCLPGTAQEIVRMSRTLGAGRKDNLLGAQATESEIRRRSARGELFEANVIAFATNGLLSGDLQNSLAEPALALTSPATPSQTDDGLLTAPEAAELELIADWIVLSACNTAAGANANSEGLSGLARAFLHAGGRGLLVSHWRLPDDVAGRITTRAVELTRAQHYLSGGCPNRYARNYRRYVP
jgi:hypothetical protein